MANTSAAQAALANSLIVSLVLDCILDDVDGLFTSSDIITCDHGPTHTGKSHTPSQCPLRYRQQYGRWGVLLRCAQVNSLWFALSVPRIWQQPFKYHASHNHGLQKHFAKIDPGRRHAYAEWVEIGSLWTVPAWQLHEPQHQVLAGVRFPRMRTLYLPAEYSGLIPGDLSAVETLIIDPHHEYMPEMWFLTQDDTEKLFPEIVRRFPKLKVLEMRDELLAYPGEVEKLQKAIPHLEIKHKESIREKEKIPKPPLAEMAAALQAVEEMRRTICSALGEDDDDDINMDMFF